MNDFTLDNVNEMYIDVLREIGNIGAGNDGNKLISGATILGDGEVALILDANTLM